MPELCEMERLGIATIKDVIIAIKVNYNEGREHSKNYLITQKRD